MEDKQRELDSKRTIVRQISHEIRTPLNVVAVGLDLVRRELLQYHRRLFATTATPTATVDAAAVVVAAAGGGGGDGGDVDSTDGMEFVLETLSNCEEGCSCALEIISDFLAFEKLSAGMYTLEQVRSECPRTARSTSSSLSSSTPSFPHLHALPRALVVVQTPTALVPYLQKSIKLFRAAADGKSLAITLIAHGAGDGDGDGDGDDDGGATRYLSDIDPMKMSNVLRNLLSNAIKVGVCPAWKCGLPPLRRSCPGPPKPLSNVPSPSSRNEASASPSSWSRRPPATRALLAAPPTPTPTPTTC